MGSALNSVMGGGGGGLLGSIGGIVGGIFGGPIGSMIGQAVGNLLQDAIGGAVKDVVNDLQKEHGMPKFLADQVKDKVDQVIDGLQNKDVPQEATDTAKQHFGDAIKDFQSEFRQNLMNSILDSGSDEQKANGKGGKGGSAAGGGWLQAIAKAMGKTLGEKASEMVKLSNKMSDLNDAKQATNADGSMSKEDKSAANEANAQEFNETMTQFQATSQEYSMLNNVFSTAIKQLGEALSSMARKQ